MGSGKSLTSLGLTPRIGADVEITELCVDSRQVSDGALFAALPGTSAHGATFVAGALERGAVAILTDAAGFEICKAEAEAAGASVVVVENPRAALAWTAALWFGAQPETMVAVTGTNGKTSVSTFCRQIWMLLGIDAVNIGTTGVEGVWTTPLRHTTPEPITLHRVLAEAHDEGVTHAAMEASSHGLEQRRLDGVRLAAAGFTNFSQDHLDYHESFEAYFAAKMGLFTRVLSEDGVAVVNLDDPKGPDVAEIAFDRGQEVMGVGRSEHADLRLLSQSFLPTGQRLRLSFEGRTHAAELPLIGGFQAENILMAAALVIAAGADPEGVFQTFGQLGTVRGRMERAATKENGAPIFVDYAHTPDAVETALKALRPHVEGRIVAIVGAGGDRDPGKRPLMGKAATENADVVIVTDDNPRSEPPEDIRAAVLDGAPDAMEVGDRAEAILRGIDLLEPGDALLIAGKGHETGQIVGDDVFPFDDVEQASVAVAALEGRI